MTDNFMLKNMFSHVSSALFLRRATKQAASFHLPLPHLGGLPVTPLQPPNQTASCNAASINHPLTSAVSYDLQSNSECFQTET